MSLGLSNTIQHSDSGEAERETGRQGVTRPHYRLSTSHHWTRSQYTASNNHSEYREHENERSGHTSDIAQFSLVFIYGLFYDIIRYITLNCVKWDSNS
jgi:hypothetical protein